jgi:hypothetical protein
MVKALSMHVALWHTLALRLAILYDAPLGEQQALVNAGAGVAPSAAGTVYAAEWSFLIAVVAIQNDQPESEYAAAVADLQELTRCKLNFGSV